MTFLLDTNAISEIRKPQPDSAYRAWLEAQDPGDLYLSVLSLGELRRGVVALPVGPRRSALEAWLAELLVQFSERTLVVDQGVASAWADIMLIHRATGRAVGTVDQLIAATALTHGLTVVTRNVRHFEPSGCKVVCPWPEA